MRRVSEEGMRRCCVHTSTFSSFSRSFPARRASVLRNLISCLQSSEIQEGSAACSIVQASLEPKLQAKGSTQQYLRFGSTGMHRITELIELHKLPGLAAYDSTLTYVQHRRRGSEGGRQTHCEDEITKPKKMIPAELHSQLIKQ